MLRQLYFLYAGARLRGLVRRGPEAVRAEREARWRALLRRAHDHSPFYRRRLRGLDLGRCQPADLPPLTKAEMMAHFDDLVTDRGVRRADLERFIADRANLGRYYQDRYAVCHTSGSQGQPALVVQHWQDFFLGLAVQMARGVALPASTTEALVGRLLRPARLAVVTQKPGFYPSGSSFAYLAAAQLPFLRVLRLSVFDPLDETVARLNGWGPDFLSAYPSALEALAREERAGRLRLRGRLRGITSISEPLPPPDREAIEEAFGVHVADNYSLAECMALSSGCPVADGAHVNADLAWLEVVDDDYRPVPDGTPGRKVLVTNLYNRVQPILRYEADDVVTMSPTPCPCGSPLPLIRSVAGRAKAQFWVEVGGAYRDLPYYLFLAGLHHYAELAEHQVLQVGRNRFLVRGAPQPGKTLSADRLRDLVMRSVRAEGLAGVVEVEAEVVGAIRPDPRSGKVERARNLIGPPPGPVERDQRAGAVLQRA